jgi:hypothetical protein
VHGLARASAPKIRFSFQSGYPLWKSSFTRRTLALFKKRLAESHTAAEREVLMKLLADEEAKEPLLKNGILKPR